MDSIPKLSLPGNLLVLGVNVLIVRWTWPRGGAWRILSVLNAMSALYQVSKIAEQL